jgi:MFS family permease
MHRQRLARLFLNVGHAYDHFFMLIYPTVVLALGEEFAQPYETLLSLATAGFIAFAAGTLPAGWLGDRWSRTGMMTVFFLGIGVASILTGLARSPFEIGIGLGCIGLFGAIYHPVGVALVVQGTEKVGQTLGMNGVCGNLGMALAGITTGALTDLLGWRAAFMLPGGVAVITGVAYGVWGRKVQPAAAGPLPARHTPALTRDIQRRVYVVLIVAALCGGLVFTATTVALPKVFAERLTDVATSTFGIGSLVSLVFGMAAVAQIPVGYWLDRYAFPRVLVGVSLAQIPLLLAMIHAEHLVLLLLAFPLMCCIFGEIPINDWVVARYTTEHWRSRIYALKYVLALGVSALAVPLVAWLHSTHDGFRSLFLILAMCVLPC